MLNLYTTKFIINYLLSNLTSPQKPGVKRSSQLDSKLPNV